MSNTENFQAAQQKYQEEREKRVRDDGLAQFIDLSHSEKFRRFQEDPWVDSNKATITPILKDGSKIKFLIQGAGFGGLLFAVRLVQAGYRPEDICLVDIAGGFGGTWYWNRYPGLMCDVESYIYLPLLEETGFIPKNRYSYGEEIREYIELIANKWGLQDRGMFQTQWNGMTWDDEQKEWVVDLKTKEGSDIKVRAQYIYSTAGLLNIPQLPDVPGIVDFDGQTFHSSRWDYECTGGSQQDPSLTKLKGKRVAVVGTGATAIQAVPELAKWADELFVFQRTPSAVDERGQRPTDMEAWTTQVATKKGWQTERKRNFVSFVSNVQPQPESEARGGVTQDRLPEWIGGLHAEDFVRQERIRGRVDEVVKDKETAEKLKAWYAGWCKRPTFHDHWLPTFNLPHVHLVDTDGKGINQITKSGVVVGGKEYPVDVLIWCTGYRSPGAGTAATRGNMTVIGRGGKNYDQKQSEGIATLHGVVTRDFPNLFIPGPSQAGVSPNFTWTLDLLALHSAYIISEAEKRAKGATDKLTIEPYHEAEEGWAMQIAMRASFFAALVGCTPSYLNMEGKLDKTMATVDPLKAARGATWGEGFLSYLDVLEAWKAKGGLEGLEVVV